MTGLGLPSSENILLFCVLPCGKSSLIKDQGTRASLNYPNTDNKLSLFSGTYESLGWQITSEMCSFHLGSTATPENRLIGSEACSYC